MPSTPSARAAETGPAADAAKPVPYRSRGAAIAAPRTEPYGERYDVAD